MNTVIVNFRSLFLPNLLIFWFSLPSYPLSVHDKKKHYIYKEHIPIPVHTGGHEQGHTIHINGGYGGGGHHVIDAVGHVGGHFGGGGYGGGDDGGSYGGYEGGYSQGSYSEQGSLGDGGYGGGDGGYGGDGGDGGSGGDGGGY